MGNDGGSIPTRRELVKNAARLPSLSELKATALESQGHAWTHCAVSDDKLDLDNAVSDWCGCLYNYESILQSLMPSEDASQEAADRAARFSATGIASLRDIVKLKLKKYAPLPGASKVGEGKEGGGGGGEMWACPVSLKELGPATKAVYLVPCGHVFAEVATREIKDHACPECSEPFEPENVIPLLPREDAELERLRQRMEDLKARGLSHSLKKDKSGDKKKRKKRKAEEGRENDREDGAKAIPKKETKSSSSRTGNINNAMTASLTAKVLAEQEERNKRRKLAAAR